MNKFNFFIKLPKLQFTLNKPLKNFFTNKSHWTNIYDMLKLPNANYCEN